MRKLIKRGYHTNLIQTDKKEFTVEVDFLHSYFECKTLPEATELAKRIDRTVIGNNIY